MLYCVQNFSHFVKISFFKKIFVKISFFKKIKKTTMALGGVKSHICDDGAGVALGDATMLSSGGGSG